MGKQAVNRDIKVTLKKLSYIEQIFEAIALQNAVEPMPEEDVMLEYTVFLSSDDMGLVKTELWITTTDYVTFTEAEIPGGIAKYNVQGVNLTFKIVD
tara:strand:+ start:8348 stop:8638 length:291 start_codon:yes stop_codon:yes gene_type:complete